MKEHAPAHRCLFFIRIHSKFFILHSFVALLQSPSMPRLLPLLILTEVLTMSTLTAAPALGPRIDAAAAKVEQGVIATRRDIHEHPELGNREERTAKLVADRLRALGIEVQEKVPHTGGAGVLA